jgi:hypothetical protein
VRKPAARQPRPRPSVPDPRQHLLRAVLTFVRAARSAPGVQRIALLGSLATAKPVPKDADVLVTIDADIDLSFLARISRRLKGAAQKINLGADIFLADETGCYLDKERRGPRGLRRTLDWAGAFLLTRLSRLPRLGWNTTADRGSATARRK